MLYALPNLGRRSDLLTRAAKAFGLRSLREDPCAFARLLERTIADHDRWFTPRAEPEALSAEEIRAHGSRLEELIDEAVSLALELYPRRQRDAVLLVIAVHAERLMRRIWSDPWRAGSKLISELGRQHQPPERDGWRKLSLIKSSPDDTDP